MSGSLYSCHLDVALEKSAEPGRIIDALGESCGPSSVAMSSLRGIKAGKLWYGVDAEKVFEGIRASKASMHDFMTPMLNHLMVVDKECKTLVKAIIDHNPHHNMKNRQARISHNH